MPIIPLFWNQGQGSQSAYFYVNLTTATGPDGITTSVAGEGSSSQMSEIRYAQGEIRDITSSITAPAGTTLSLSAPTFTLFQNGVAVTGLNGVPVTGYDTAAASTVNMNYLIDTSALLPGTYVVVFEASAVVDNGTAQKTEKLFAQQILIISRPGV